MKVLFLLFVIATGNNQLEAQTLPTVANESSKPITEMVFLKPTKSSQNNYFETSENTNTGRYVEHNGINAAIIPYKSAFAKKNRYYLRKRKLNNNETSQNPDFQKKIKNLQYTEKKNEKLDIRHKINKVNISNIGETLSNSKLSKASLNIQTLNDTNRLPIRMTLKEFINEIKFNNHYKDILNVKQNPKLSINDLMSKMKNKINEQHNNSETNVSNAIQKLNNKFNDSFVENSNKKETFQKPPKRLKRSEQYIPFGDPSLPPQILLAQAFVSGNKRDRFHDEHPAVFVFPNVTNNVPEIEVTTTNPVFSKIHAKIPSLPPSPAFRNSLVPTFYNIHSFPTSEFVSKSNTVIQPGFTNINEDKSLIQRIIEDVNQGRGTFIPSNSNFPRARFVESHTNTPSTEFRKNPLPKGIKKITINSGVSVYLKPVNKNNKLHEVYGPPKQRSKRSAVFESVFSDNTKSSRQKLDSGPSNINSEKSFKMMMKLEKNTLKVPLSNSPNSFQEFNSPVKDSINNIISETLNYSYILGPTQSQKIYGASRQKRFVVLNPIFESVFSSDSNSKSLQQRFFEGKENSVKHVQNSELTDQKISSGVSKKLNSSVKKIQKNFDLTNNENNIRFKKLTSKLVLPKNTTTLNVTPKSDLVTDSYGNPIKLKPIFNLILPKPSSSKSFAKSHKKYVESITLSLPKDIPVRNFKVSDIKYNNIVPEENTQRKLQSENLGTMLVSNVLPELERLVPFSTPSTRYKRSINSIFESVFRNDRSNSLQERFFEGSQRNIDNFYQHKPHQHSTCTISHSKNPSIKITQEYGVPNFNKPSAVPFESYGVPTYFVQHTQIPHTNRMTVPKIKITKYFSNKSFTKTLTLPSVKNNYKKVIYETNFSKLPKFSDSKPVALPILNKSKVFLQNIETAKLQIPNYKTHFVFLENGTKYQLVPGSKFINQSHSLSLPASNPKITYNKEFMKKPVENYSELPKALVDNINYNAQFVSTKSNKTLKKNGRNQTDYSEVIKKKEDFQNDNLETNSFTKKLPDLPKEMSKQNFNQNLYSVKHNSITNDLPKILNNNSYDGKWSNLPNIPKVLEENIKYNLQFISKANSEIKLKDGATKTTELLPKIKNGQIFNQKMYEEEYKIHNIATQENTLKIPKTDSNIEQFSKFPISLPKVINENIKYNSQFDLSRTTNKNSLLPSQINKTKFNINPPTENILKIPKTDLKVDNFNSKNMLKLATSERLKTNFEILTENDLKLPKPDSKIQEINFKNVLDVPINLSKAIEENVKYNSQFILPKINKTIYSNTNPKIVEENPLKIPKMNSNLVSFNSENIAKLITDLPKPIKSDIKYNSQFIPTQTNSNEGFLPNIGNSKTNFKKPAAIENTLGNPKTESNYQNFNFKIKNLKRLKTNFKILTENDLKLPKTDSKIKEINFKNVLDVPSNVSKAIEENIKYNSQFILPKIDKIVYSNTNPKIVVENPFKIPKTNPTLVSFNSENIPNLTTDLPKPIESDIKFNSQFIPTQTNSNEEFLPNIENSKTIFKKPPAIKNTLGIPKTESNYHNYNPEIIKDLQHSNTKNDLKIPKTDSKVEEINFKIDVEAPTNVSKAIEENIKYNSQFILPNKNNSDVNRRIIVQKKLKIRKLGNNEKCLPKNQIETNTHPKPSTVTQFQITSIPKGSIFKENAKLQSSVFDKNFKEIITYNAQFDKNQEPEDLNVIEESGKPNQDNNRADIPIENEISENNEVKNSMFIANRTKFFVPKRGTIKTNNTIDNIRKNFSNTNIYNANSGKSRYVIRNRNLKNNNTEDALDDNNLKENNISVNKNGKNKDLVKVVKRPSRKNIVLSLLNKERAEKKSK